MADHPQLRRDDIDLLRNHLVDLGEYLAIVWTVTLVFWNLVDDLDPGPAFWQRFAATFLATVSGDSHRLTRACLSAVITLEGRVNFGFIEQADLVLVPDVKDVHWADFGRIDQLIEAGRISAMENEEEIIRLFG